MDGIDLDRLHKVANGSLSGRQQGHTFLAVTNLAGIVSLKEPVVYCLIDSISSFEYLKNIIIKVFKSYELPSIDWIGRTYFTCLNSKIFFIIIDNSNDNSIEMIRLNLKALSESTPAVVMFEDTFRTDELFKLLKDD